MAHAHDITLCDLQDDAGAVLRRAEQGEHLRVVMDDRAIAAIGPVDEEDYWVDSSVMEHRIRGAQADPAEPRAGRPPPRHARGSLRRAILDTSVFVVRESGRPLARLLPADRQTDGLDSVDSAITS